MDDILCPRSGKCICKRKNGASGAYSRYLTEFYEVGLIKAGGYGCVFKCANLLDGNEYAIKKIRLRDMDFDFDYAVREVKSLVLMNHPNIVRYYSAWVEKELVGDYKEAGIDEGVCVDADNTEGPYLFIQMELCFGSLADILCEGSEDILERHQISKYFRQIADGLHHMHKNAVRHGDLSPRNIFFDKDKNIKIGDFGLASLLMEAGESGSVTAVPLGPYCAPEVKSKNYTATLASDIYSFGIILLEMIGEYATTTEKDKAFASFKQHKKIPKSSKLTPYQQILVEAMIKNFTLDDASLRLAITDIVQLKI